MNISWLSKLFPATWAQLLFISVAGLVLLHVFWCLGSALSAAIRKSRIEQEFKAHVDLLGTAEPIQTTSVLYAQASHAVGEAFDRRHLEPALLAIDLIPKASLALTVLSLIFLIPEIGQNSFNGAFAQKLWITFFGMGFLIPAQFLVTFAKSIFGKMLNEVVRQQGT
jgi:hypothetical protein